MHTFIVKKTSKREVVVFELLQTCQNLTNSIFYFFSIHKNQSSIWIKVSYIPLIHCTCCTCEITIFSQWVSIRDNLKLFTFWNIDVISLLNCKRIYSRLNYISILSSIYVYRKLLSVYEQRLF